MADQRFPVEASHILMFARAIGDPNPAYRDPDSPEAKAGLTGALVRKFVEAGSALTPQDILRPQDRGFLASVLAPPP